MEEDGKKKPKSKRKVITKIMENCQGALKFLWQDLRKPHLIWVKAIFFFQTASLVTLYPYLTIHMRALGFSIEDASVVNSVIPGADVFGPPLAGLLADKLGNFRLFMSAVTLLNGLSSLLLLTVPTMQQLSVSESFANMSMLPCNATGGAAVANMSDFCDNGVNLKAMEFWHYVAVRVLLEVLRASSLMLFEGAVVAIIKEQGGDYGIQKLFGTLGGVVLGPLAGKIIDFGQGPSAYTVVIVTYCCLRSVTALLILKLELDFKPPAKRILKNLGKVVFQVEVMSFVLAFMFAGILWGFLDNFLFWYLEDLGATKLLMGVSLAIGTLAGLPVTVFSSLIINKLGHRKIVVLALSLYVIRMFAYSLLKSAEPFVAFEVFKPLSTSLLLISVFTFIKNYSPVTTAASVEAIFGSAYFGIGKGLGGLLGGLAMESLGAKMAFTTFGYATGAAILTYISTLTAYEWYQSKNNNNSQQQDEEKAEEEKNNDQL